MRTRSRVPALLFLAALAPAAIPREAGAADVKKILPDAAGPVVLKEAGCYELKGTQPVAAGITAFQIQLDAPGPVSIDLAGFQLRSAGANHAFPIAIEVVGPVTDFPLTVKNGAIVAFTGGALVAPGTPTRLEDIHVIACGSGRVASAVSVGPASRVARCRFDQSPAGSLAVAASGIVKDTSFRGGTIGVRDSTLGAPQGPSRNLIVQGCTFGSLQVAVELDRGVIRDNSVLAAQYGFSVGRTATIVDNTISGFANSAAAVAVGANGRICMRGNTCTGFGLGVEFADALTANGCQLVGNNVFQGFPWNFPPGMDVDNHVF